MVGAARVAWWWAAPRKEARKVLLCSSAPASFIMHLIHFFLVTGPWFSSSNLKLSKLALTRYPKQWLLYVRVEDVVGRWYEPASPAGRGKRIAGALARAVLAALVVGRPPAGTCLLLPCFQATVSHGRCILVFVFDPKRGERRPTASSESLAARRLRPLRSWGNCLSSQNHQLQRGVSS